MFKKLSMKTKILLGLAIFLAICLLGIVLYRVVVGNLGIFAYGPNYSGRISKNQGTKVYGNIIWQKGCNQNWNYYKIKISKKTSRGSYYLYKSITPQEQGYYQTLLPKGDYKIYVTSVCTSRYIETKGGGGCSSGGALWNAGPQYISVLSTEIRKNLRVGGGSSLVKVLVKNKSTGNFISGAKVTWNDNCGSHGTSETGSSALSLSGCMGMFNASRVTHTNYSSGSGSKKIDKACQVFRLPIKLERK